MAIYSKAAKREAKRGRGRPRRDGIMREPNGRAARSKEPPAKVALLARMKVFGMTASEALSVEAADNLGRLHLAWKRDKSDGISVKQYDAAERYREVWNEYRKTLCSPGAYYEQGGTVGASDPSEYYAWVLRAKIAYEDAQQVIMDAQIETRTGNLFAAVSFMLIEDRYFPHMLGDIRLICNALHRHFFTQKRKRTA